jgi:hypothetical protein
MSRLIFLNRSILVSRGFDSIAAWMENPSSVYIGDDVPCANLTRSIWCNPHDQHDEYRRHITQTTLITKLHSLEGKALGCNCNIEEDMHGVKYYNMRATKCKYGTCHGRVLLSLLDQKNSLDVPLL